MAILKEIKKFLFGKEPGKEKIKQLPTGNKQQTELHNQLISQVQNMLKGMGGNQNYGKINQSLYNQPGFKFRNINQPGTSPLNKAAQQSLNQSNQYYKSLMEPGSEAYEQFSQPFLQQFQEQIIPGLEERYAGAGALSSSGFGQSLGAAGAGLQSQLANLFAQLQQQGAQGLAQNAQLGFGQGNAENQLAQQWQNLLQNQEQMKLNQNQFQQGFGLDLERLRQGQQALGQSAEQNKFSQLSSLLSQALGYQPFAYQSIPGKEGSAGLVGSLLPEFAKGFANPFGYSGANYISNLMK